MKKQYFIPCGLIPIENTDEGFYCPICAIEMFVSAEKKKLFHNMFYVVPVQMICNICVEVKEAKTLSDVFKCAKIDMLKDGVKIVCLEEC